MTDEQIENIYIELAKHERPFRIYLNPMRYDGVFIGQDKPIEPYPDVTDIYGKELYPAIPQKGYVFPHQIPLDVAESLLRRLNKKEI